METPVCAIILVQYGEWTLLHKSVRALIESRVRPSSIFVVDNGPGFGSFNHCLPSDVRYLRPVHNLGFAGGANLGIQAAVEAQFDFALLLNPDAPVSRGVIQYMMQCMRADPTIAVCGPVVLEGYDAHLVAGCRIDWRSGRASDLPVSHPELPATEEVDYVPGCAMLLRLAAIRDIGPFSEGFFLYWEDADLCTRARQAGWRVVICKKARIRHLGSQTTSTTKWLVPYYMTRNSLYFFQKHSGGKAARIWVLLRLMFRNVAIGMRCLFGGRPHEGRGRLIGVLDYCRGKLGPAKRTRLVS